MTFRYGTTRMANRFYVEYVDEQADKWYGDLLMNDLVSVFPTYGDLFEHFKQTFDNQTFQFISQSANSRTLRVPTKTVDLNFVMQRMD